MLSYEESIKINARKEKNAFSTSLVINAVMSIAILAGVLILIAFGVALVGMFS